MRLLISNFLSISVHYEREVALFNIAGTGERWRGNYRRGGRGDDGEDLRETSDGA